jgi:signal transduction histidine kinase
LNARVSLLLQARRYSAQLRQRNDDLQAMVHALNHDLRAPARISAGFAKLLLDEYGPQLDDQARHYIQRIRDANEHSRRLLNQLLDFAQLGRESIAIQRVELDQVVTVILNNISDIRHDAQIFINRPLPTVQADFGLLELALTNLFANALKYVAPGASPHVTFTATVDNGLCRITVADRGIGIPAEEQGRIFQPFVRLHGEESYPGAGLGLAAASKAVQLMDGRIGVESKPGTGSTFWIILPVGA